MQISGKGCAIIAAIIVVIVAVWSIFGKPSSSAENQVPVFDTGREYNQALKDAEEMTKAVFEKINRDEELTVEDRTKLSKAASLFEGLQAFEPRNPGPYIALGLIYRGLNQPDVARKALELCLSRLGGNTSPDFLATSAEVHYQLSRVEFDAKRYDYALAEASTAIQTVANNPNYLAARGAAFMQSNRLDEAKKDFQAALKLDPQHARAGSLLKLLEHASKPKS